MWLQEFVEYELGRPLAEEENENIKCCANIHLLTDIGRLSWEERATCCTTYVEDEDMIGCDVDGNGAYDFAEFVACF